MIPPVGAGQPFHLLWPSTSPEDTMPFARRDADGVIDAVFANAEGNAQEELPHGHPELLQYLGIDAKSIIGADEWLRADLALARVTEDLITNLMDKGVIAFTDLPAGVQEKIITRQGLRLEVSYVASLFGNDDENFL
jgi:hypothetical protein